MAVCEVRMPRLSRSLCGLSLETGVRIVAYYHLIAIGALYLLATIFTIARFLSGNVPRHLTNELDFQSVFFRSEAIIASIMNVLVASAALLHGVRKKEAKWMEPFLWTKGVLLAVFLMDIVNGLSMRIFGFRSIDFYIHLALTCVDAYMYVLVYNLYGDFKEKFGGTVV